MKTSQHPFSRRIHYAVGGTITPEKADFRTYCGRSFRQGHDEIMQSGMVGAANVTCRNCQKKLTAYYP